MLGQFLLNTVGVCAFLVHFVNGNNDGNPSCLCVVNGFHRLGHNAVIGSNHKNGNIRNVRTTRPHGSKRLMSGCVKEGNIPAAVLHLISTNMLRNAACFGFRHICTADFIQNRSLAVVNVSHNNDHRAAFLQIFFLVRFVLNQAFLDGNNDFFFNLCAQFFRH